MGVQIKLQVNDLQRLQILSIEGVFVFALFLPSFVQAQSLKSLQPICVGLTSSAGVQSQSTCCQHESQGTCMTVEEAFPKTGKDTTLMNDPTSLSGIEFERPKPIFKPRTSGSEAAAKDAIFQMGFTKIADILAPTTEGVMDTPSSKPQRKNNFFRRVRQDFTELRQDYEYVFRPRQLDSGAVLTPRLNVDFSSFKAGVKIEF